MASSRTGGFMFHLFLSLYYQVVSLTEYHRRIDALNSEDLRSLCKRLQVPWPALSVPLSLLGPALLLSAPTWSSLGSISKGFGSSSSCSGCCCCCCGILTSKSPAIAWKKIQIKSVWDHKPTKINEESLKNQQFVINYKLGCFLFPFLSFCFWSDEVSTRQQPYLCVSGSPS